VCVCRQMEDGSHSTGKKAKCDGTKRRGSGRIPLLPDLELGRWKTPKMELGRWKTAPEGCQKWAFGTHIEHLFGSSVGIETAQKECQKWACWERFLRCIPDVSIRVLDRCWIGQPSPHTQTWNLGLAGR
jgi:hypothetical protein